MTIIGTMIWTITDRARRARRRWRQHRAGRRALVAFQKRLMCARGAGSYWSSMPRGDDGTDVRSLTADERRQTRPTASAPHWIPSAANRAARRRRTGA